MTSLDLGLLTNLAITQLIQLTVLIGVVGLINYLLSNRYPSVALALWSVVFFKALTPPLWSADFGLFSWLQARAVMNEPMGQTLLTVNWSGDNSWNWLSSILLGVWLSGSLCLLAMTLFSKHQLSMILKEDRLPDGDPLLGFARRLAKRYGLRPPHGLVVSRQQIGPAVAGVRRPLLILPSSLVEKSSFLEMRPVILHELVHADRRDTFAAVLFCVVRAVWWFHPMVWWATREADRLIERCVDVTIVRDLNSGLLDYARGLVRVLELRAKLQVRQDLSGIRPCQITIERLNYLRRFHRNANPHQRTSAWSRHALFLGLAVTLLPSLPTDALQPQCDLPLIPCRAASTDATSTQSPESPLSATTSDTTPGPLLMR